MLNAIQKTHSFKIQLTQIEEIYQKRRSIDDCNAMGGNIQIKK
jgi:hypothetical protein